MSDVQTVYRVRFYHSVSLEKVEATMVTKTYLRINGSRVKRTSHGIAYFDDFDAAKAAAVDHARADVVYKEKHLAKAKAMQTAIEAMTPESTPVSTTSF